MAKYRLAVFDMDGTILNTLDDLADTTNYILAQYGMPQRSLEEIRCFVGNGIRNLIIRAAKEDTPEETIDAMFTDFMAYYKDHCAIKTAPYEGIVEVIHKLREKGILTAVVSNKADVGVQELCKQFFLNAFDMQVGEREGVARKPAPDSVFLVLEELGVEKKDAVYIGDSEVDAATAKNSDLDFIGVTWGFREEAVLLREGAKVIVRKPEDLLEEIQ